MKRYRFEVREEFLTPIEVEAETEREARNLIQERGNAVVAFDPTRSDPEIILLSESAD